MNRSLVLVASALMVGLAGSVPLILSGCGGGPPSGGDCLNAPNEFVTLTIPGDYDVTVTAADVDAHTLVVNTPSMSSGHAFEVDVYPATVADRGSLNVHTAISSATLVYERGNTLVIKVAGSNAASTARFGVNTSDGLLEANASSGWVLVRFSTDGTVQGYADLRTEDPRVPTDLRHYTSCFAGALATDGSAGNGGTDGNDDIPAPPT